MTRTHWIYMLCHAVVFLAGAFLVFVWADVRPVAAVGTSMIAAGVAGWLIFVYVLVSQRTAKKLQILSRFGLVHAFEGRSVLIKDEYDKRLEKAHEQIDVMGFGLRTLREDYAGDFEKWKARANVRILLLDPEYPDAQYCYASQRDYEEDNPGGAIRTDVMAFARAVRELLVKRDARSFEVRLYRCLPSVNVFRIDDELFWGPYLMKAQSRNTPTFVVRRGGVLYKRLTKHFDEIWKDDQLSRFVPATWLADGDDVC